MVVKPLEWLVRGPKGWAQPALKVRGREYLRIIYGPEYTEPANLKPPALCAASAPKEAWPCGNSPSAWRDYSAS